MSTNSPAQFVPSTPKFGYNTDDAHACSSPVAVVPSMQRSLDRTIDSSDAAVPRTPVSEPISSRTPNHFRVNALRQTPISRYAAENLAEQEVPSTPKTSQNNVFQSPTIVAAVTVSNASRAERPYSSKRQPRRILPPAQCRDHHTLNLFSGDNIFS
ncbi:uncharacterized protein LOC125652476 isoform X2 [Ostrea edulis]|uniref:uncharacterized protein LOC125652476 isoform X2 n=1 Tax=Ostrea edulis TaxID=37623 RepID=UPI00209407B1|nr:uncharacterized protein LOC125652476 isoform X2 [Ostrea edulis]